MTRYDLPLRQRAHAVPGDGMLRAAIAMLVCAIGGLAFVTSYSGIYRLGNEHGLPGAPAALPPLSTDGLIMSASLVLLHEVLSGRAAPGLARAMLWLGTAATAAAGITYYPRCGLADAVILAWPTVALPGAVEMAMQVVRRSRTKRAKTTVHASRTGSRDAELIAAGIRIREQAERDGVLLGRRAFASQLRERGYSIANGRLSWLRAACGFSAAVNADNHDRIDCGTASASHRRGAEHLG